LLVDIDYLEIPIGMELFLFCKLRRQKQLNYRQYLKPPHYNSTLHTPFPEGETPQNPFHPHK
jgi:hypothetical protein